MHTVINVSRYEVSEKREGADYKESNMITSHSPFRALQFKYNNLNPKMHAIFTIKLLRPLTLIYFRP
jgi:hypothetical protein